jgi:hypothetical protein
MDWWGLRVANVHAKLGADLVSALAYGVDLTKGEKVLPYVPSSSLSLLSLTTLRRTSLGLNVNFPKINCMYGSSQRKIERLIRGWGV